MGTRANYLRALPLNLLMGTPPASSIVVAKVVVLRFRNILFVVGVGSCSSWTASSASMAIEVLSADCGRDIEAEAMAGSTGSEPEIEGGFGARGLCLLGTGASSN